MCLGLGQKNFDIIAKKLVSPYKIAASPILQTKCLVYFDNTVSAQSHLADENFSLLYLKSVGVICESFLS